jgi:hypothetical protein
MLNKTILYSLLIFPLYAFAQSKAEKRLPSANELTQLKIFKDSIELELKTNPKQSVFSRNQLVMNYLKVYSYFQQSSEVVMYTSKQVKYVLGAPDSTFKLSRYNDIIIWQYGNVYNRYSNFSNKTIFRFYMLDNELISVTQSEDTD